MKKRLFTVLATVLMLSGCSNEEAVFVFPDNTPVVLSVSSASFPTIITKATTLTGGSIGVFLSSENGYTPVNNVQYTYAPSTWVSNGGDISLGPKAASVCAYYPYSPSITNSFSVPLQSQIYSSAGDLCYTPYVANLTNISPSVTFDMVHAYSRITFAITRDNVYPGTCNITGISLANSGIKTQAVLDITNGAYSSGTIGSVSFDPQIATIASGETVTTGVLLVPVAGLSDNIDLVFTIDGKNLQTSLPVGSTGLGNLSVGVNYKISISIKVGSVTGDGVIVPDWIDGSKDNVYIYTPKIVINGVTTTDWTDKSGVNNVSVLN